MPQKSIYIRPEDLPIFDNAQEFAKAKKLSTSQLLALALNHYLNQKKVNLASDEETLKLIPTEQLITRIRLYSGEIERRLYIETIEA